MLSSVFFFLLNYNLTGIKVEGILRQSADVEEVERRVQEYEQGICFGFIGVNVPQGVIICLLLTAIYILLWLVMILLVWFKLKS